MEAAVSEGASMGWIIALAVVIGIPALIAFWGIGIYNGLVKLRNGFRNAFAQIDVQLKRRHDLIPNLVETAKGYLAHEKQTLEAVIAARGAAVGARESAAADPGNPVSYTHLTLPTKRIV